MLKQLFAIIMVSLLTACSSTSYTTQESEEAYLQLQGNFTNSVLEVDKFQTVVNEDIKKYELNGKLVADFPVSIGAHHVVVYKAGKAVLSKKVFVTNGQTVEVVVP
mgnify:FL=1